VHDLASSHEVYSVHGPWAWELLGEALGQEVIGQPYLSLQHVAQVTCFRGGKTGEYGYDLLMPRASVEATLQRLREVGAHYELGPLSLEAVDRAALENWFYCVRFAALWPFTPLELQLQWRLWHEKHGYVGAAAIAALRARGVERRLTVVHVAGAVVAGEQVTLDGERVGEVLMSAPREGAGELAWAMLAAPYAVAGLSVQVGAHAGRTVSPPTVMNQSLGLDPNKHSFRYGRVP
jgi:glycine cleavage system aminomethyltransferase T